TMESPWQMNSTQSYATFLTVNGFRFDLQTSSIYNQGGTPRGNNGYVIVTGTGIVISNGYTPTAFTWSFTSQDPKSGPGTWTFSAQLNSTATNGSPWLNGILVRGNFVM